MDRPYYWIVNPVYKEYQNTPKQLICVDCAFKLSNKKLNNKKHNIQTVLHDENEKKYRFELEKGNLQKFFNV
jgi:hypothetical protein